MKTRLFIAVTFIATLLFATTIAQATALVSVRLDGQQAKHLYDAMIGPAVQNDAATGHFYRRGKSILCMYINADMSDQSGASVPKEDPKRYSCTFGMDQDGLAMPVAR